MGTAHKLAEEITRQVVEDTVRSQFRRANLATIAELANQDLSEDAMVDDALGIAFGLDSHCINDVEVEHGRDEVHLVEAKIDEILGSSTSAEGLDRQLIHALKSRHIETPEALEEALRQAR